MRFNNWRFWLVILWGVLLSLFIYKWWFRLITSSNFPNWFKFMILTTH